MSEWFSIFEDTVFNPRACSNGISYKTQRSAWHRAVGDGIAAGKMARNMEGRGVLCVHQDQRISAMALAGTALCLSADADIDDIADGNDLNGIAADRTASALQMSIYCDVCIAAEAVESERMTTHSLTETAFNGTGNHHGSIVLQRSNCKACAACAAVAATNTALDASVKLTAMMVDENAGRTVIAFDRAAVFDDQCTAAGKGQTGFLEGAGH